MTYPHLPASALDLGTLRALPALKPLADEALGVLGGYLEPEVIQEGKLVISEGAPATTLYFIIAGEARILRDGLDVGLVAPGDHFGAVGLVLDRVGNSSVIAASELSLARLDRHRYQQLSRVHPAVALALLQGVLGGTLDRLSDVADSPVLWRERSTPRREAVEVILEGITRSVRMGTFLGELLPPFVSDLRVVAALLDRKAVSLKTPVSSDCTVEPLTTGSLDGQRFYRNSQALLLLEAASRLEDCPYVAMSHSVGMGQRVTVRGVEPQDLPLLAGRLEAKMHELVAADLPLLEEMWTVEEARDHFGRNAWENALALLETWRDPAVPLVSYGTVYAIRTGPLLASTGKATGFELIVDSDGLLMMYGGEAAPGSSPPGALTTRGEPKYATEALAVSRQTAIMTREQERWLATVNIKSVGALNQAVIRGKVGELIHVSEGFQEKSLGRIADAIHGQGRRVRIVCIAGPSSAGKTTFIKRLRVQLQVLGINPVPISLDNYYVDRERTPLDAEGEYDFEALEALQLDLLHEHLARLVRGETVVTAKYSFPTGRSIPEGGPVITLQDADVLLMEGIHGLNPNLLSSELREGTFGVFVCPLAQLPFDRLTRVHGSDVRLIRRIVRDRHHRGHSAADSIQRWPSVRAGERRNIFAYQHNADAVFDSSLIYELAVLKVFGERYLLEVPSSHPAHPTAFRLLQLLDRFVPLYPEHVPPTSILREFVGGSTFDY